LVSAVNSSAPVWPEDRALSERLFVLHRWLGIVIGVAAAMHIAAALHHHFVREDRHGHGMILPDIERLRREGLISLPQSSELQQSLHNFICFPCCSVPCRPGSSRRAFQSKPHNCLRAANGCTKSSMTDFG
jgi:hypothetical protein